MRRSLAERLGGAAEGSSAVPATERVTTRPGTSAPSAGSAPAAPSRPGPAPSAASPSAARAPRPAASRPAAPGPRRVRLSVSRVDPWSAMKLSFLLSVALGVMIVVAAAVVWFVLDSMRVFSDVEELLVSIGSENFLQLMDYLEFDRVMSFATIVGVVDILLLTALGTIGAFLYNIVAALVGGLHMTLTDD
ncbi:DUF3566 domain-containing protein [Georgenia muralis]|uniref:Transmembrane protein DUF3566 n=1 Tax=Georgenia muralis TaxID=154117 RepID=A0A3N4Z2F8_9MICO|nr:DUF3566 domain-containing protein [Georgenia muralis]RPF26777.1 transmembrane protein DUF3566 [Georgenia muralis]